MTNIKVGHKQQKQWGTWAFARHCHNIGVDFDACYYMIFGVYPNGSR